LEIIEIKRRIMAKNMDKGNTGLNNKPKLSIQEKKLKKKMKQQAKLGSSMTTST